jgi:hypothetical protein
MMKAGPESTMLAVSLADYVLGIITAYDLPAVALRAIMDGHESLSLAALAGCSPQTYNRWETEELLSAALRELSIGLPSRDEAAQIIIDDALRSALAGTVSPASAVTRIVSGAYYGSDAPLRDSMIAGDSLGIGDLVGVYWMYDEADQPWSPSAQELDREAFKALQDLSARRRPFQS